MTSLVGDPATRTAEDLLQELEQLRDEVVRGGDELLETWRPRIEREAFLPSARNLAQYIVLRRHELRLLQVELSRWGLSSLGRCEARVLDNLDAVIATARALVAPGPIAHPAAANQFRGAELLRTNSAAVLGALPNDRAVRIMVTLPSEAATNYPLVREFVDRGMDVARINCGHDDAAAWTEMARHVRRASEETGRPCRISMDISGPRCRTTDVHVVADPPRLHVGDLIAMTYEAPPSQPEGVAAAFRCSIRAALEQVQIGHSVWIDEGKLGATVESKDDHGAVLRVHHARPKGERLKTDKGLNFPDTELELEPLTPKDLRDLDVVTREADIVAYSFAQRPSDIVRLQDELAGRLGSLDKIALVAKIESQLAVSNLPELIVQGAGRQPMGVMIARGDLAVEIGSRRLGEIQEEILWLCEAAHIPVVWATQVLDTFVHKGVHHRAEMTDAVMAERAECVMVNKGPYAAQAVALLDDVLAAMEGHQFKKSSRMRALRSW